jgi:hypothetical protein
MLAAGQDETITTPEKRGRRLMYRYFSVAGLVALAAQGCASSPANTPKPLPLSSFSAKYQTWGCDQLAEEADLLDDALAVATDGKTVAHIKRSNDAVREQSTLKGCKLGGASNQ